MNNEQFGIGMKITVVIICILLIGVGIVAFNVVKTDKDTTTSILDEMPEAAIEAQIENEDEFKQYLQVFALGVQEEAPTTAKKLETVIGFLNQIFWYEPIVTDEAFAGYEKDIVKSVAIELLGIANVETSEEIILDENYNVYRYAFGAEFINGKCMEINEIKKEDKTYFVEYTCTFPGEGGLYDLSEGIEISLPTYKIKAEIQENENYEYSKYCLKSIELISKDIVKYN